MSCLDEYVPGEPRICFPDIIDWMAIYTGYIWGTWCILYPYTCWRYFHHFPRDFHTTQAIKQGESSHFTMMFPSFSNSIVKIWLLVSSFILSIVGGSFHDSILGSLGVDHDSFPLFSPGFTTLFPLLIISWIRAALSSLSSFDMKRL